MDAVFIASDEADARAAEAVEAHHAQLSGSLSIKVETVLVAGRAGQALDEESRSALVHWCRSELVPHVLAEEGTLYAAAAQRPEGRLLVEALLAEHQLIVSLVEDLEQASDQVTAAATAHALRVVFDSLLAKENEQVLPLLVSAPDVSVADLLGDRHELVGGSATGPVDGHGGAGGTGHACQCNEAEASTLPELDAREIPHAIRHATIFGALDGLPAGHGLVLVAPHDPLPLLAQLEGRAPGAFTIDYLQRGPEAWRLRMVRVDRVSDHA